MKTSFGEYFDAQRDRLEKMMQNKNAQQNIEWMEAYEKRQEEMNEKELEVIKMTIYDNPLERRKVFDWLWSPEEKRTVLGLLKGRKMKKKLKEEKEKNV